MTRPAINSEGSDRVTFAQGCRPAPRDRAEDPENRGHFQRDLIALIPHLRAYARGLCGDFVDAEDLAQDAVEKAWSARQTFTMGTNMKAWTFMILRNQFYSIKRRAWRQSQFSDGEAEESLVACDNPEAHIALDELRRALLQLPPCQRDALMLVGAGGFEYEQAARICGCAIGTVKSRVSRARSALQTILDQGQYATDGAPAGVAYETLANEVERLARPRD